MCRVQFESLGLKLSLVSWVLANYLFSYCWGPGKGRYVRVGELGYESARPTGLMQTHDK